MNECFVCRMNEETSEYCFHSLIQNEIFQEKPQIKKYKKNNKIEFCKFPGCMGFACYGRLDSRNIFCEFHKTPLMVYTRRLCAKNNCCFRGVYGSPRSKEKWCSFHRDKKKHYSIATYCLEENCNKFARYKYYNESNLSYCKNHSLEGMILFRRKIK